MPSVGIPHHIRAQAAVAHDLFLPLVGSGFGGDDYNFGVVESLFKPAGGGYGVEGLAQPHRIPADEAGHTAEMVCHDFLVLAEYQRLGIRLTTQVEYVLTQEIRPFERHRSLYFDIPVAKEKELFQHGGRQPRTGGVRSD